MKREEGRPFASKTLVVVTSAAIYCTFLGTSSFAPTERISVIVIGVGCPKLKDELINIVTDGGNMFHATGFGIQDFELIANAVRNCSCRRKY